MKIDIKWVKAAQSALLDSKIVQNTRKEPNQNDNQDTGLSYPKAYKGYISSLAASIVQSGLVPALSIYESDNKEEEEKQDKNSKNTNNGNNDKRAENNRALLIDAISIVLQKQKVLEKRIFPLSDFVVGQKTDEAKKLLHHFIHQALVALKLALRMYRSSVKEKRDERVALSVSSAEIPSIDVTQYVIQPAKNEDGNVGWIYYKDLYRSFKQHRYYRTEQTKKTVDVTEEHQEKLFAVKMKALYSSTFNTTLQNANKRVANAFSKQLNYRFFLLKTLYPGLLSGTGLSHGVKLKSDIKVGFLFDYATGLPYIPGASVKGVLRSVFPDKHADDVYNKPRIAYLKKKLEKMKPETEKWTDEKFYSLSEQLFEDATNTCYRDVFLDALMVKANSEGKFLGNDYITPHKSPFLDPVPIQLIKVLPEVQFRFSFLLNAQSSLSVEEREKLYLSILLDVGMGAKTNVGYGHMQLVSEINQPCRNPKSRKNNG